MSSREGIRAHDDVSLGDAYVYCSRELCLDEYAGGVWRGLIRTGKLLFQI